jgi:hypothetical protein
LNSESSTGADVKTDISETDLPPILLLAEKPKKKKLKKGIFNREWLKIAEYQRFLKEYKSDSS